MSDIAIRVENLSKRYKIGVAKQRHDTLSDQLMHTISRPFQKASSLFSSNGFSRTSAQPSAPDSSTIWALKNISFEVEQGEVIGIIGRNGAGKSTLLKILTRITEPTEGRAEIYGRVGSLLEVGTGFHPELTGRENIYLNGAILGMGKKEINCKFNEIVDFAEVAKFIDTPVKRYSSGMYVRLAFAVAAHLEPEILMVDEVLAVGDAAFQKKCLGKMGDVAKAGRTVLFVSHNSAAISNLTQRCICIANGGIAAMGKTENVMKEYLSKLCDAIPDDGFANLSDVARHPSLTGGKAEFNWVRTLDETDRQTGTLLEGKPFAVELGFRVIQDVRSLQFGCVVEAINGGVELFTAPSPEFFQPMAAGTYSVKMYIDPNHLRCGEYSLAVKMFADGQRQDTIGQVLKIKIQPYLSPDDNTAYLHMWVAGYLRFDYGWSKIKRDNPSDNIPRLS